MLLDHTCCFVFEHVFVTWIVFLSGLIATSNDTQPIFTGLQLLVLGKGIAWIYPPTNNCHHQDDITFLGSGIRMKPVFVTGILGTVAW